MKPNVLFLAMIIFIVISIIGLGIPLYCGCIPAYFAQYVILGLTLVAILVYAYFTYRALQIQQAMFRWNQNPVLASGIKPKLLKYKRTDEKVDFRTIFEITNLGRVHAVAQVDINPMVDGKAAKSNDAYAGKRWWYVPARKGKQAWFSFVEILDSVKTNLSEFQAKKLSFKLEIKVTYKRWEQREGKPMLENPPDIYYYDHDKQIWIHQPTTSEIEFPVFSEEP